MRSELVTTQASLSFRNEMALDLLTRNSVLFAEHKTAATAMTGESLENLGHPLQSAPLSAFKLVAQQPSGGDTRLSPPALPTDRHMQRRPSNSTDSSARAMTDVPDAPDARSVVAVNPLVVWFQTWCTYIVQLSVRNAVALQQSVSEPAFESLVVAANAARLRDVALPQRALHELDAILRDADFDPVRAFSLSCTAHHPGSAAPTCTSNLRTPTTTSSVAAPLERLTHFRLFAAFIARVNAWSAHNRAGEPAADTVPEPAIRVASTNAPPRPAARPTARPTAGPAARPAAGPATTNGPARPTSAAVFTTTQPAAVAPAAVAPAAVARATTAIKPTATAASEVDRQRRASPEPTTMAVDPPVTPTASAEPTSAQPTNVTPAATAARLLQTAQALARPHATSTLWHPSFSTQVKLEAPAELAGPTVTTAAVARNFDLEQRTLLASHQHDVETSNAAGVDAGLAAALHKALSQRAASSTAGGPKRRGRPLKSTTITVANVLATVAAAPAASAANDDDDDDDDVVVVAESAPTNEPSDAKMHLGTADNEENEEDEEGDDGVSETGSDTDAGAASASKPKPKRRSTTAATMSSRRNALELAKRVTPAVNAIRHHLTQLYARHVANTESPWSADLARNRNLYCPTDVHHAVQLYRVSGPAARLYLSAEWKRQAWWVHLEAAIVLAALAAWRALDPAFALDATLSAYQRELVAVCLPAMAGVGVTNLDQIDSTCVSALVRRGMPTPTVHAWLSNLKTALLDGEARGLFVRESV